MTISNLMKMAESHPNGKKTLWEKEKLLVTSIFSFSHNVFKRLVSQGHQKVSLCGNGLNSKLIVTKAQKTSFEKERMLVTSIFSFPTSSSEITFLGLLKQRIFW